MLGGGLGTKGVSWLVNCVRAHPLHLVPKTQVPTLRRKYTTVYEGFYRDNILICSRKIQVTAATRIVPCASNEISQTCCLEDHNLQSTPNCQSSSCYQYDGVIHADDHIPTIARYDPLGLFGQGTLYVPSSRRILIALVCMRFLSVPYCHADHRGTTAFLSHCTTLSVHHL